MSSKKQLLIDTALELFYENGINSVGINEILKVSGVAKKTLYSHFKSKDDLVVATLEQRDKRFLNWLETELSQAKNDTDVVYCLFNALTAWFKNEVPGLSHFRGCYFINTSAENNDKSSAISRYCAYHKSEVRKLIQAHLKSDDSSLLDMICLLKEGAIVLAHTSQDYDAAQKCIPLVLERLSES